jgi:TATA-box binding protein (TBP) (component of TFIID and TFIIIB)
MEFLAKREIYGYEDYDPYFKEAEFKDEIRLIKPKPYPLQSDIQDSMMTIITSFSCNVNIYFIYEFFKLKKNGIVRIELKNHPARSLEIPTDFLLENNNEKKDIVDNIDDFYNQVTLIISTRNPNKFINIKVFQNGTVHLSGCKNIDDATYSTDILLNMCKKTRAKLNIIVPNDNVIFNKDKIVKYIYAIKNFDDIKLQPFSFNLDNKTFMTNFNICSWMFLKECQKRKWIVKYNPNRYSGVILKYTIHSKSDELKNEINKNNTDITGDSIDSTENNKQINCSFLVFKSGKITISGGAGATNRDIVSAYTFINNFLKENYKSILKLEFNLDPIINSESV